MKARLKTEDYLYHVKKGEEMRMEGETLRVGRGTNYQ